MRALASTVRASEWWESKLAPMLGTGYATAYLLGASLGDVWTAFLLMIVAVIPGTAYVSLVNDFTDLRSDRVAGKPNRVAGWPRKVALGAIGLCLSAGILVATASWRDDGLALALYLAGWVAFSLYSIPPIRLKGRGVGGVLADAAGAHVFPHLLIAVLVFRRHHSPIAASWLALIALWSLLWGVRGILWHQLNDSRPDWLAGVPTFGRVHRAASLSLASTLFPLEVILFMALLVRTDNGLAVALFALFGLLDLMRARLWRMTVIVVLAPRQGDYTLALHDYYVVLYPLAFLIAASVRQPRDAWFLLVHFALFPRAWVAMIRNVSRGSVRLWLRGSSFGN